MSSTETNSNSYEDLASSNDLQAAQIREIAANGAESLQKNLDSLQDNSAAMGRWVLASLLAMNSGGAIAALSASDKVIGSLGPAIIAFALGSIFAVATGINGLITGLRSSPILVESIELLRLSILENVIHATTREKLGSLGPIVKQQLRISAALSSLSLISFAFGIGAAVL